MSIQSTDLVYYKSAVFNDTGLNGGEMSFNQSVSGVSGNIFPTVNQAERTAGSIKYRKIFVKNQESTGLTLFNGKFFIENPTQATDYIVFFAGTLTNTQSAITGSERLYGCGYLNDDVTAGATTVDVMVEATSLVIFAIGDEVRISNKTSISDNTGTEERVTLSGVSLSGNLATLTFTPALDNDYVASATRVSSVYNLGDLETAFSSFTENAPSGAYDISTYPIQLDNRGTIRQNWTLTFTSTNAFSISGDTVGSVGSGTLAAGAAPLNPANSQPYFTLLSAGFSGSFAIGNQITFTTTPSAKAVWFKRVVPAGMSAYTGNRCISVIEGESE